MNKNLVSPATRFIGHYYYDESNKCWFCVVNVNTKTGYWYLDLMIHSVTGWKRRNDPMTSKLPLDAKKFASHPFVF